MGATSRIARRVRSLKKGRILQERLDSVVPSGQKVFPLGCQRPAGVTEILKRAPEETKDWIVVRLPTPS